MPVKEKRKRKTDTGEAFWFYNVFDVKTHGHGKLTNLSHVYPKERNC